MRLRGGAFAILAGVCLACDGGRPPETASEPEAVEASPFDLGDPSTYIQSCEHRSGPERSVSRPPEGPTPWVIEPGEVAVLAVDLEAGELLDLVAEQEQGDLLVCLYGPEARILLAVDRPTGVERSEDVLWLARATGEHRIELSAFDRSQSVSTEITYEVRSDPSDRDLKRAAAWQATAIGEELRKIAHPEAITLARQQFAQALAGWRDLGDGASEGDVLYRWGELERLRAGDPVEAARLLERAAPLLAASGLKVSEAHARFSLGRSLVASHRAASSSEHFSRAAELWADLGDARRESTLHNELAYSYQLTGKAEEALFAYGRAIERARHAGASSREATSLHNRGVLYSTIGLYDEARDDLGTAQQIRRALPESRNNQRLLVSTLTALGNTHLLEDRLPEALRDLEEALPLRKQLGDLRGEAVTSSNIGRALQRMGEVDRAVDHQRRAVALFAELEDEAGHARALYNLGVCLREAGQSDEAAQTLERALAEAHSVGDGPLEIRALVVLGQILHRDRKSDEGLELLHQALDRIDELRSELSTLVLRAAYFATQQQAYDAVVDVLYELDRSEPGSGYRQQAFEVAERGKARALLDLLAESGARPEGDAPRELVAKKRELWAAIRRRQRLADPGREGIGGAEAGDPILRSLEREYGEVEAMIRSRSTRFHELPAQRLLGLAEVQAEVLGESTVLLFYRLGEERSHLWVVRRDAVDLLALPARKTLEASARQVHELLSVPDEDLNGDQAALTLRRPSQPSYHRRST